MKLSKHHRRVMQFVRNAARIAGKMLEVWPVQGDSTFKLILKAFALLDIVDGAANPSKTTVEKTLGVRHLCQTDNACFVDIFLTTKLKNQFEIEYARAIDTNATIMSAHRDDVGTLYVVLWDYGTTEMWHSAGFKFDKALGLLWEIYGNHIHISAEVNIATGRLRTQCSSIPKVDMLVGSLVDRILRWARQHLAYRVNGISRTYLFAGKQGGGKSCAAVKLGELIGQKMLRLDSSVVSDDHIGTLDLILSEFKPDVIILDDVDRISGFRSCAARLLTTMQDIRRRNPDLAFILTANSLDNFDAALIRPGRVDEIICFDPPDVEDRRAIIRNAMDKYCLDNAAKCHVDRLAEAGDGLTASYLQEACIRLRCETLEEVVAYLESAHEFFEEPKHEKPKQLSNDNERPR